MYITMEETVAELFSQAYRPDLHLEFPTREELNKMFNKIEKKKKDTERLEIMRKIGSLEAELRELKDRLKHIEENTTHQLEHKRARVVE